MEATDRLLEFARGENLSLLQEFETFRNEFLSGRTELARERCAALQERLAAHVKWEEREVYPEFAKRCRASDASTLRELEEDHRMLVRLLFELSVMIEAERPADAMREVFEDIDAELYDHRLREEADVCAPLDHVLDAPTKERIELALEPRKEVSE